MRNVPKQFVIVNFVYPLSFIPDPLPFVKAINPTYFGFGRQAKIMKLNRPNHPTPSVSSLTLAAWHLLLV
jgi:hypothetical protein